MKFGPRDRNYDYVNAIIKFEREESRTIVRSRRRWRCLACGRAMFSCNAKQFERELEVHNRISPSCFTLVVIHHEKFLN